MCRVCVRAVVVLMVAVVEVTCQPNTAMAEGPCQPNIPMAQGHGVVVFGSNRLAELVPMFAEVVASVVVVGVCLLC